MDRSKFLFSILKIKRYLSFRCKKYFSHLQLFIGNIYPFCLLKNGVWRLIHIISGWQTDVDTEFNCHKMTNLISKLLRTLTRTHPMIHRPSPPWKYRHGQNSGFTGASPVLHLLSLCGCWFVILFKEFLLRTRTGSSPRNVECNFLRCWYLTMVNVQKTINL